MLTLALAAVLIMSNGEPSATGGSDQGDARPTEPKVYGQAATGFYRQSVVIKSDEQLSLLTPANGRGRAITGGVAGLLKVKTIDWDKQMLVVIYGGEQPTGGYSVKLKSLETKDGKLIVHWKLNSPPPDAIVTQALTYPELLILVDRFDGDVVFDPPAKK
jgi:hypothetical protein